MVSLIEQIDESISEVGQTGIERTGLKYVLVVNQKLDLSKLLPSWYQKAVNLSQTSLQEFKIYVEDLDGVIPRETEVVLSSKDKEVLEIKITSPDETLANSLVSSIRDSSKG